MVTNEQNQIAVRKLSLAGNMLWTYRDEDYVFVAKANIALAWCSEEAAHQFVHHPMYRKSCCGGTGKPKKQFIFASEDDVRRWTNNGGR